jgi:hypothetical protein
VRGELIEKEFKCRRLFKPGEIARLRQGYGGANFA